MRTWHEGGMRLCESAEVRLTANIKDCEMTICDIRKHCERAFERKPTLPEQLVSHNI